MPGHVSSMSASVVRGDHERRAATHLRGQRADSPAAVVRLIGAVSGMATARQMTWRNASVLTTTAARDVPGCGLSTGGPGSVDPPWTTSAGNPRDDRQSGAGDNAHRRRPAPARSPRQDPPPDPRQPASRVASPRRGAVFSRTCHGQHSDARLDGAVSGDGRFCTSSDRADRRFLQAFSAPDHRLVAAPARYDSPHLPSGQFRRSFTCAVPAF